LSAAAGITATDILAARRELARRSLRDFTCMVDIPTIPAGEADDAESDAFETVHIDRLVAHHDLLLGGLQDVADKKYNLMVLMPPGSAKSTYTDVVFVPWFLARKPRQQVILGSYASSIARKQGRRARTLVKSKGFCELFPDAGLSNESSAADEWALNNGSEFMAGGLLSGITGNRADLGIVDDPIKGREDAESQVIRDKAWDAYHDDFCTRLKPGACQVMILTRWHEDDPAGRILPDGWDGESGMFKGKDGRPWRVICLPAICDRADDPLGRRIGEGLWPEWFPASHWEPFKTNARTWASLYQQKPKPSEGSYFLRGAFKRFTDDQLPSSLRYYGTSDYAVTEDGGDYTVLRVWGVDSREPSNVYLVDGWRGQTSSDIWIEQQIDLMEKYRRKGLGKWFGEAGVIQKAIMPVLQKRMRERRVSCAMEWLPSIQDKATRARGAQAIAQEGRLYIRDDGDGDCFIDECVAFPAGKHDDDVDNLSLIGRALNQITAPRRRDLPQTAIGAGEVWG
jgi:predicted phage terminase large subunit-like protein